MTYKRAAAKFVAGDHLRVWRPRGPVGYYHHGIYINDARVVQFGGRIGDKHQATIGAVPLSTFENGGTAKLVPHGGRTWWGAPRFDTIPRDVTVGRAERLVEAHPEGLYDLFGYNCEQAANFCSTNSYESYQVRGYFAARSFLGIPVALYIAARNHDGRPFSRVSTVGLAVWIISGLVPTALYHSPGRPIHEESGAPAHGVGAQSTDVNNAPDAPPAYDPLPVMRDHMARRRFRAMAAPPTISTGLGK